MPTSSQAQESPRETIEANTDQLRHTETEVDETELLSALRAGQEWAFEVLVRTSSARLLAVARRFVRTDQDAQGYRAVRLSQCVSGSGSI